MPPMRSPVRSKENKVVNVTGLFFAQNSSEHTSAKVATIVPPRESLDHPHFPAVEHILGIHAVTHKCFVTVLDGEVPRKYIIFFQYDKRNVKNIALERVSRGVEWRGEILVMRQGRRTFVTGIYGRAEKESAIKAVQSFLSVAIKHIDLGNSCRTEPLFPSTIGI